MKVAEQVIVCFCCGPKIYQYGGWTFEVHSYLGPWPLKKDGEPRERVGRVFWAIYDKFSKLDNKEDYRV